MIIFVFYDICVDGIVVIIINCFEQCNVFLCEV